MQDNKISDEHEMEYLKKSIDDWDTVTSAWRNTYHARQKVFENKTVHEIFEMFPCLSQPNVGQLVSTL